LGEASHGTSEYYTWRIHITKRLIAEKNFNLIAVEEAGFITNFLTAI
jgi:erythromycin esterase-like protein